MNWRILLAACTLGLVLFAPLTEERSGPRVGSKKFTESVILGELVSLLSAHAGAPAVHIREMGGTRLLYEALAAGEIDVYPEYTGTLLQEILRAENLPDEAAIAPALAKRGLRMSAHLGFNNGYAIGMLESTAAELGIDSISDLARHPELALGFSNEFLDRGDGWPALRDAYGLPQQGVSGMDHDVAYRQLQSGGIAAMEVYTTDADILAFGLRILEDDRSHFRRYDAVLLYGEDLEQREPALAAAIERLSGQLPESEMMAMNKRARMEHIPERQVAADYLEEHLGVQATIQADTRTTRVLRHTREHLSLVRISFLLALLIGLPLGVIAAKWRRLGELILGVVGIIQTIPALALLVLLIRPTAALGLPSVGAGSAAAIAALCLYSLLPIVRNTCEGLRGVPRELVESAAALGLPPRTRLWRVELPMASRTILAGLETAAVLNIGFATLGALIGAGGLGQPILTGIRLDDYGLILEGALPAAALALIAQALFTLADRLFISQGLREF
ncbi:MAG: osmoprotectant transport system permease protein [Planctomycetota bacterium]